MSIKKVFAVSDSPGPFSSKSYVYDTEAEAVERASELAAQHGKPYEIVTNTKIVRPETPPVKVEDIK